MNKLIIDNEFKNLIHPLTDEEFKQLEANIIKDGCREPLVIWGGYIVDGHNRYQICVENNIEFQTVEKDFPDKKEAIEWIILNQFGRRNLSLFQRSQLALKLKPIIQEKAKETKLSKLKQNTDTQKSAERTGEVRDVLAKLAGVSHDTIEKTEKIISKGTPEQIKRVEKGGKGNSVNAVYKEIRKQNVETKVCKKCGIEKHIEEFYSGKNSCKICLNGMKPYRDIKGNSIKSNPEVDKLFREQGASLKEAMLNPEINTEYTISDLAEEIKSVVDYFIRNVSRCLTTNKELLSSSENQQKIIAVLSEAETAITKNKKENLI